MRSTNHTIYEERLTSAHPSPYFDYVPRCIYFYYIVFDGNRLRVDHFFYNQGPLSNPGEWNPIAPSEVEAILPGLVANARSKDANPPLSGNNFQDVVWTYKSHMAFVVDAPGWVFRKSADGAGGVAFNVGKGSTPNHSFFDGRDLDVMVPRSGGEDIVSTVAFINHMKRNSAGDDLGHETQDFTFDVYFEVGYEGADAASAVFILDPDGQNQGPPQSP